MLGQFGRSSLSNGRPERGAFEFASHAGDGAFERIAELARFLLDCDAAIVDLDSLSADASGLGVSIAPGDAGGLNRIADPVTALRLGFVSQASVPIRIRGAQIGTLAVVTRTQRAFDARGVETLQRLADLVAENVSRHLV